jgi:hypothetical protein
MPHLGKRLESKSRVNTLKKAKIDGQPELREHGVGALAVDRVIELVGVGCGVVACKPWPLQFTPAFAENPQGLSS